MEIERSRWSADELQRARELAREYLKAEQAAQPPPPNVDPRATAPQPPTAFGPLFKAAAVSSRFRIEDLATDASDAGEVAALRDASLTVRDRSGNGWRVLMADIRNAVIARMSAQELAAMLGTAPAGDDPARDALRRALGGVKTRDVAAMETAEIAALLQVYEGLSKIVALPPIAQLERKLELARLLEPMKRITATFSGRTSELQALRNYVGVLPPETLLGKIAAAIISPFTPNRKPPFMICGPGGVGKTTLVARFILEHALVGPDMQFPFAYLDFDRPTVMAGKAGTLFLEAVRQIGVQYDGAYEASERLRERGERALRAATLTDESIDEFIVKNFADFLETLEVREGPVLFVLDTFEEVQRRSSSHASSVMGLMEKLAERVPRLRVVVAGRGDIGNVKFEHTLTLAHFDEPSAVAYLARQGIDESLAKKIFESVGGSPLALTLAVDLVRRDETFSIDETELQDEAVQALLFDRILMHIDDPDVRALAHPGLILRRITEDLIREVLAPPCGIPMGDPAYAGELFYKLAQETTLVTQPETGVLVHRSDIRRLMLGLLRRDAPRKVEEIHRRAVEYYSRNDDTLSRAEQVYHRLSLHQSREEVAPLVSRDLEPYLVNSIEELEPPEQALLADLLSLELPAAARSAADQLSWERGAARIVVASMRSGGDVKYAAALLAERSERSSATELRVVEVQFLNFTQDLDDAERLAADGIDAYRRAGKRELLLQMLLAAASVDAAVGDLPRARGRLAEAEDIALRANDPLMTARVLDGRARLLRPSSEELDSETQAELVTAVARVSDAEWARELPLLRGIAEAVGRQAPAILGRALNLGALELTDSAREYMRQMLAEEGIETQDVQAALIDIIYKRTPPPRIVDALADAVRGETVRRDQRAQPRAAVPTIRLKASQREQLRKLLVQHYGSRLGTLLESRFETALEAITFSVDRSTTAMEFIRAVERDRRLGTLFVSLLRDRYDDAEVLGFLDSAGMAIRLRNSPSMSERELRSRVQEYRGRLGALATRTCAIEIDQTQAGSGILTGTDEVTSVLALVKEDPAEASFRFDEATLDGERLDAGRICRSTAKTVASRGPAQAIRIQIGERLGDAPVDAGATDSTVKPRGIVDMGTRTFVPGDLVFWLWRENGETWISGARLKEIKHTADGRLIVDAPTSTVARGCAVLDAEMNVVGLLAGPLEGDAKRSTVLVASPAAAVETEAMPPAFDPFAVVYAERRVFVNREALRHNLREMLQGNTRIAVITGPRLSGKSYTTAFVRYFCERMGLHLAHLNLSAYAADGALTHVDLGLALARELGFEDAPAASPNEPPMRWIRQFVSWLGGRLETDAWVIVDDFDTVRLPGEAEDLIAAILDSIAGRGRRLRCILIGYEHPIAPELEPLIVREMTSPIAEADIRFFFERFGEQERLILDSGLCARLAEEVFAKMSDAGDARLRVMSRELTGVCESLLRQAPAAR